MSWIWLNALINCSPAHRFNAVSILEVLNENSFLIGVKTSLDKVIKNFLAIFIGPHTPTSHLHRGHNILPLIADQHTITDQDEITLYNSYQRLELYTICYALFCNYTLSF